MWLQESQSYRFEDTLLADGRGSVGSSGYGAARVSERFLSHLRLLIVGLVAVCSSGISLFGQDQEQAIGLVLKSAEGKLRRAGSELPLTAKPGDLLFGGDALVTDGGSVSFLYCPARTSQNLAGTGEVVIDGKQLKSKTGQLTDVKQEAVCILPRVERESVAGQKHLGASLTGARELDAPPPPPAGSLESRIAALPEQQRAALQAELAAIDKLLAADTSNLAARVARAAVFEKFRLGADALEEYRRIQAQSPDAVWVRSRLFVHEQEQAAAAPAEPASADLGGKTYALLIGISTYQVERIVNLRYAHEDALLFAKHLKSPRGGGLSDVDITVLTNEQATLAAVRNAFETLLKKKAGKQDTVLLFFAAHGTTTDQGVGYIITHDSDPQDLASTALPMRDVQKLFRDELSHVGRVLLYVDVCRAGSFGAVLTRKNRINTLVENLTDEGEMFGMLASRKDEVAIEGPQFGGGHGAFSFFLLDALNGAADANNNKVVDAIEIVDYVTERVQQATASKQNPKEIGNAGSSALAMTNKPGITLQPFQGAVMIASRDAGPGGETSRAVPDNAAGLKERNATERFQQAIEEGRILPGSGEDAFTLLSALRKQLAPDDYLVYENRLRVALEDRGHQVLLRYLTGDQIPQSKADFMAGASYFSTARLLTPESMLLEAREDFCLGRAALFDKEYGKAADLLERSVRIDSTGAYGYNALGISYLEQGKYDLAVLAFRDASARAPYWAYPLHNAALAYIQMGDYNSAIRSYNEAIRLAPKFSYLPYNLGLVYQRLNRRKEAESAYKKAIELAPDLGEPYNALGYLKASTGDRAEAERLYREALSKNPDLLPARHNLALVLAEDTSRFSDAVGLWNEVLAKQPDYLPSRLSLAKALANHDRTAEAIEQYQQVVAARPDYIAARRALADLQVKAGKADAAIAQLTQALHTDPENPLVFEHIGDIELARGQASEARAAFDTALKHVSDDAVRKRIRKKLKGIQ